MRRVIFFNVAQSGKGTVQEVRICWLLALRLLLGRRRGLLTLSRTFGYCVHANRADGGLSSCLSQQQRKNKDRKAHLHSDSKQRYSHWINLPIWGGRRHVLQPAAYATDSASWKA